MHTYHAALITNAAGRIIEWHFTTNRAHAAATFDLWCEYDNRQEPGERMYLAEGMTSEQAAAIKDGEFYFGENATERA